MRISKLIELLEAFKADHGDCHIRAYNRRGDDGVPKIERRTIYRSGNKNTSQEVHVTTEIED